MSQIEEYQLHNENLIPFYLVEDRIKHNFGTLQRFMSAQQVTDAAVVKELGQLNSKQCEMKVEMERRFVETEKKIAMEIGRELEGRIILAINKNMATFASRMDEKERQITEAALGMADKMEAQKKQIMNEVARDNQKALAREVQKLEKKINSVIDQSKKVQIGQSGQRPSSKQMISAHLTEEVGQHYFTEEWVLAIKETQARLAKAEQFLIGFDKRFYESMSALKESWKELGSDQLQTKRKLTVRQDEMKLQLVKVKMIKEFEGSPQDYEETFKNKLMNKFTDIYQLIGQLVTRADMESEVERVKKTCVRQDSELSDLREEMGRNAEYFTFYVNNANTDDLSAQIKLLHQQLEHKGLEEEERRKGWDQKEEAIAAQMAVLNDSMGQLQLKRAKVEQAFVQLRGELFKEVQRIDALEEHNNFTPQKMAKIHNSLDIDFSPSEQELIGKKPHANAPGESMAMREVRLELNKMKDEMFVLTHQLTELERVKKSMTGLEGKLDKMKVETDEAMVSRKPWVCLSCDKNEKEKQDTERVRREVSRKKLLQAKTNPFSKEKSDKLIRLIPAAEQKFEVYEKYREKYLSESIKLPDIYKQKIGEKEPQLG